MDGKVVPLDGAKIGCEDRLYDGIEGLYDGIPPLPIGLGAGAVLGAGLGADIGGGLYAGIAGLGAIGLGLYLGIPPPLGALSSCQCLNLSTSHSTERHVKKRNILDYEDVSNDKSAKIFFYRLSHFCGQNAKTYEFSYFNLIFIIYKYL